MPKILIVDDEWLTRLEIEEMLTDLGYDVAGKAETGAEAVAMARELNPDLILMDVKMPGEMNGIDAAREIKAELGTPIVFISGYGDPEYVEAAKEIAPFGYVMKPFDEREIHAFVEIALSRRELELKLQEAHDELERRVESRTAELEKANKQLKEENEARKRTEEALRESEEHHRSFMESAKGFVVYRLEVDPENYFGGRLVFVSPSIEDEIGVSPETEFNEWFNSVHPDDLPRILEAQAKSMRNGDPFDQEFRWKNRKGEWGWCHTISNPVFDSEGNPKYFNGMMMNVTAQKQAVKALQESEEKFRLIAENSIDAIWQTDLNNKVTYISPSSINIGGYTPEEVMRFENALEIYDDELRTSIMTEMSKLLQRPVEELKRHVIPKIEGRGLHKDGHKIWVEIQAKLIFEGNMIVGVQGISRDISERKEAEAALLKSEKQYRTLMDNLPIAVNRNSPGPEGAFLMANPASYKMFGFKSEEEFIKLVPTDIYLNPEERKQYSDILIQKGMLKDYETTLLKKDGTPIHTSITSRVEYGEDGEVSHFDSIMVDITDQKNLEAKLRHAHKMEAIGTLAGGVAHDLNNILSGLVSFPELLLLQLPEDNPLRKSILIIQKSGEKAAAVVQDLLTLARRGVVVTEVVNLNDVVDEYLKSPEHEKLQTYHPGVHIDTHLEKDALNILGSPTHLSKTVMNLVSNAAEAMPEGGNLTVSTEDRYIDRPIRGYDHIKEGDYVVLTMSDTGTGISPDDIEKIFEPFYTKKKMGRSGTGLGMAVVWGTVKDHNGYIDVQSAEGKGTTFTLYFPVTRKSLEERSEISIKDYMGKGEAILVIDDVEGQRNIASGMLEELGYSVAMVSSGEEAVEYLKTNKADLLLLDMIMDPGMDGLDAYKKILEIHPEQKAIIASGFSETDRVKELQRLGAGAYIKKPFLLKKIGVAVKEELEK